MRLVDTNIFVRYLTGDDTAKTRACFDLFRRAQHGDEQLMTHEVFIAEVVYTLASPRLYGLSHQEVAHRLRPVLTLRSLSLEHKEVCLRALDLDAEHTFLDFEDALAVAHMERRGVTEIISFDRDFDRLPGIRRVEP